MNARTPSFKVNNLKKKTNLDQMDNPLWNTMCTIVGFEPCHKKCFIRSCVCRTILIRSALEDPELGSSNSVSNLLILLFGADLVTFEVAG